MSGGVGDRIEGHPEIPIMATALETPIQRREPASRIVLPGVSWRTYLSLLDDIGGRHLRLTYDGKDLEIMAPLRSHEVYGRLLAKMVDTLALELNIPISSGGSTTLRRDDMKKGLEPDQCFYIANEAKMRGKLTYDPAVDPPPDLAIEIDITRSSLDRQEIYAALGVPEIWRFDGQTLKVFELQPGKTYAERDSSPGFPTLPLGEVVRFLRLIEAMDETSWLRMFRDWVRAELVPR
jgi:Uma2 family endonuclease